MDRQEVTFFGGGQFQGDEVLKFPPGSWMGGAVRGRKVDWPSKRERHKKAPSSKVRDLSLLSEQLAATQGL